jgi:hypothetical protein
LHQNYPRGKERAPNDSSSPFKEKEKGGEGGSKAWWPMEGSKLGGQWKVKEKPFSPLPFSPQQPLPKPSIFPLTLQFYFTMVLSRYSRLPFIFFDL